jgi:SAM-dependent methyltransferase
MSTQSAYLDYVADDRFADGYLAYQARYAATPRESDRELVRLVDALTTGRAARVLDLGCSTGNLLRHLRAARPDLRLTGGDLMASHLAACRADGGLAGIDFREMDAVRLPAAPEFDVVVVNAVLYLFTPAELDRALRGVAGLLRPGGHLVAFDLFHPFGQELTITEVSETHPEGLTLHFRSYRAVGEALARAGFARPAIAPFRIPIDLPRPADDDAIISHTVPAASGERLLFRGTLHQPWCHMTARLAGRAGLHRV